MTNHIAAQLAKNIEAAAASVADIASHPVLSAIIGDEVELNALAAQLADDARDLDYTRYIAERLEQRLTGALNVLNMGVAINVRHDDLTGAINAMSSLAMSIEAAQQRGVA